MKLRPLIPVAFVGLLAFAEPPAALTPAQQATIQQEVLQAGRQIISAIERLDLEAIMQLCMYTPDFAFTQPGGKTFTLAGLRKASGELFGALASQKMIRKHEHVIVLGPDAALFTWTGCNDLVQKDGTVLRSDPYACTYLFRKVGGRWLFAFGQESGLPFAPIKEGPASEK